jgi:hypothetical protein
MSDNTLRISYNYVCFTEKDNVLLMLEPIKNLL